VKIDGTDDLLIKEVPEHSLEAEYQALKLKASSMGASASVPDIAPITVE
tara:strand:- start:1190 stop:1336 length:147 start_codon:yes stop_codon:yes gene_type:complete